jgi:hypothetical protein
VVYWLSFTTGGSDTIDAGARCDVIHVGTGSNVTDSGNLDSRDKWIFCLTAA